MKIVHLLPSLNKGGTERIVLSLASIQQKKHSVSIIVFSDSNLYSNLSKGLDIIYITENTFIEYSLFGIKNKSTSELEKILSKLAPQIIHSHSFWTDLLLLSIPYINATYVSHFHLHYPDLNSKVNGLSKKSITRYIDTRRMIRKYNKYGFNFITVSKDIDAYYKKRIPKKMWSRIHYIPNSINLEEFRPQKGFDQPSMTNKSKYTLISVSRLIALKNHTFLIYVVKKLITDNQLPVKLII
ncbi:MAG: glycosyltransferase, partial [Cytophagales bacterium]|nr:glycosyltransferase [Cytophagales bacterium]